MVIHIHRTFGSKFVKIWKCIKNAKNGGRTGFWRVFKGVYRKIFQKPENAWNLHFWLKIWIPHGFLHKKRCIWNFYINIAKILKTSQKCKWFLTSYHSSKATILADLNRRIQINWINTFNLNLQGVMLLIFSSLI